MKELIIGYVIGTILTTCMILFIVVINTFNKEQEAYEEGLQDAKAEYLRGYFDGMECGKESYPIEGD